ncbi:hypothetical protein G6O69_28130 [Pseudenhygromyxa sp. WMMC2535]|uniref:tetratricopeptide repeat protein n=1 Tax=Pseudenhygromyxa sp. WMMC2535 TaxID=2712867 RepID=UPI0015526A68|nr:tetratricopeptide repeat protein [Pseudenhygromyxa sp. WMMC2535]NVB41735.1 hypothetical protein [Pseudenhygromyxa sp. WMMC2535]
MGHANRSEPISNADAAVGADWVALAAALADAPEDQRLRAQLATALTAAGRHEQAVAVLGAGFINLTDHDGPTLPCLCKRCLQPGLATAEAGDPPMAFVRRFAVARGRVLYFWAPRELADHRGLREGIEARLLARLGPPAR